MLAPAGQRQAGVDQVVALEEPDLRIGGEEIDPQRVGQDLRPDPGARERPDAAGRLLRDQGRDEGLHALALGEGERLAARDLPPLELARLVVRDVLAAEHGGPQDQAELFGGDDVRRVALPPEAPDRRHGDLGADDPGRRVRRGLQLLRRRPEGVEAGGVDHQRAALRHVGGGCRRGRPGSLATGKRDAKPQDEARGGAKRRRVVGAARLGYLSHRLLRRLEEDPVVLLIREIYPAILGESRHSGETCAIVRLTGCHRRCIYCDTAYAFQGGETMSTDDVRARVREIGFATALVTGGEPLLQKECRDLLAGLLADGLRVVLETSGTLGARVALAEVPAGSLPRGRHQDARQRHPRRRDRLAGVWRRSARTTRSNS